MTTGIQPIGSPGQRGQTLYDYALGISLFVLTITATVGLFPSLLPTGQDGASGAVSAATDRVAQDLVTNGTTAAPGEGTTLDPDGVGSLASLSDAELQQWFALRTTWQVNVTVTSLDGRELVALRNGSALSAGATYRGQASAEAVRVVTMADDSAIVRASNSSYADCRPACRLVVRVW